MATCSVRYEPHLSDKARSSETSRFSITKIWYVYSGWSLQFLPKPEQDLESDFWMKTGPGAGAGVRISVFTGVGQLILLNLYFHWMANCLINIFALFSWINWSVISSGRWGWGRVADWRSVFWSDWCIAYAQLLYHRTSVTGSFTSLLGRVLSNIHNLLVSVKCRRQQQQCM